MSALLFEISYLFEQNPNTFVLFLGLLGLFVGSFLNVVIYRLPVMMKRAYTAESREFLELAPLPEEPAFNLLKPRSTCPKCGHKIKAWENIPVLSWLFLKAKCSSCANPISARYPGVELISGLVSLFVAYFYGFSAQAFAVAFLTWALITLAMIDYDEMLLPDEITLPLVWIGILLNMNGLFISLEQSVVGAVAGYMSLWTVFWLFKLVTGKDGMGFGDFKLLAVFGAWFGWQILPALVFAASILALIVYVLTALFFFDKQQKQMPFGPYLVVAGWLSIFYGQAFIEWYFGWSY